MGSIPGHPFFLLVIESLQSYNKNWQLPYITVMYSTGPLFLSVIWKKFMASGKNIGDGLGGGRVRILMPDEYNKHAWSFFSHHKGNSWHGKDARLIFWMGGHWMMLTALGFLLAGVVGMGLWWVYGRVFLMGQRKGQPGKGGLKGWIRPALWRMQSKKQYELVQRHEV